MCCHGVCYSLFGRHRHCCRGSVSAQVFRYAAIFLLFRFFLCSLYLIFYYNLTDVNKHNTARKKKKKTKSKKPFQEVGPLDRSVYCSGQQCAEDFSRLIFAPFVHNYSLIWTRALHVGLLNLALYNRCSCDASAKSCICQFFLRQSAKDMVHCASNELIILIQWCKLKLSHNA